MPRRIFCACSILIISAIILSATQLFAYSCGDANGDGEVNIGDAIYLISYIFDGGPAPDPIASGDANSDGSTNIGDVTYLINFVFSGGPSPCPFVFATEGRCREARPEIIVNRTGPDMGQPDAYGVLYENGTTASGSVQLLSGESDTIPLSNMYGSLQFTIPGGDTTAIENCLEAYLIADLEQLDLDSLIPDPAGQAEVPVFGDTCLYDIYIDNVVYDSLTADLIPTDSGMLMEAVYYGIIGDLAMIGSGGIFCSDIDGIFTTDSVTTDAEMNFEILPNDSVDVTVISSNVTFHGAYVDLFGSVGNLIEPVVNDSLQQYIEMIESDFETAFPMVIEPFLEEILVP